MCRTIHLQRYPHITLLAELIKLWRVTGSINISPLGEELNTRAIP